MKQRKAEKRLPSEDHHNRELAFITLSMVGIGAFLWYSDK